MPYPNRAEYVYTRLPDFAFRLKGMRSQLKISINQVANVTGLTPAQVAYVERGTTKRLRREMYAPLAQWLAEQSSPPIPNADSDRPDAACSPEGLHSP
jgi:transcriptional regulator with XRE-family HTH domain